MEYCAQFGVSQNQSKTTGEPQYLGAGALALWRKAEEGWLDHPEGEDLEETEQFLSIPARRLLSRKCQDPYGGAGQKNRRQWSCTETGEICAGYNRK